MASFMKMPQIKSFIIYIIDQFNNQQRKDRRSSILHLPVYTFQEPHARAAQALAPREGAKAQRKEIKKSFSNSRPY